MITSKEGEDNVDDSPIYDKDRNYLGVDSEGFTGEIIIMSTLVYKSLTSASRNGILDHNRVIDLIENKQGTLYLRDSDLTSMSLSKIYSHVLRYKGFDLSGLHNGKISIWEERRRYFKETEGGFHYTEYVEIGYNDPNHVTYFQVANTNSGNCKISVPRDGKHNFSTVEQIISYLGVHELTGHFQKGLPHWQVYQLQKNHYSFTYLPKRDQETIIDRSNKYSEFWKTNK